MSNPIADGGPAFPGFAYTDGRGSIRQAPHLVNGQIEWELHESGMSLWDYFAAHAPSDLTGDNPCLADVCRLLGVSEKEYDWTVHWPKALAILHARYAHAMLAERAKALGESGPKV